MIYVSCMMQSTVSTQLHVAALAAMVLTSLAVEAAEPLMEVLLVLHTCSVLAEGEVLVVFSGPLRCRKFHCTTLQPTEDG